MNGAMSAIGTKRTYLFALHMSASGLKADIEIPMELAQKTPKRYQRDTVHPHNRCYGIRVALPKLGALPT